MDVNKIKNNPVNPRVHPGTDPLRPLREQCQCVSARAEPRPGGRFRI